ncbi:MAG TPA: tRNA pseudouridine(55) synthase TruB [Steroidobacteraceae bacterium]|nr:tRNA pseudouridine(55) synthase TruB [Steroidobacteraceae bacterium]
MPTGILLLDKPRGLSSNAALQRVRRAYGAAKAGHVGSLDPLATGMLPICLDEATKIAGDLLEGRKCYRFEVALGRRTSTGDVEGAVVEECPVPPIEREALEAVLAAFSGERQQIPPMYSALKRDGQPLYRLARAGVEVERAPRAIRVDRLELRSLAPGLLDLEMLCSKGTYVRTMAEDIASALGTCGHVASLRRLYVEPFAAASMVSLDAVAGAAPDALPELLPADSALAHLPSTVFTAEGTARLRHGQSAAPLESGKPGRCRLYDDGGQFFGIGEITIDGDVQPRRLFRPSETV